jgi:hypothetical protein
LKRFRTAQTVAPGTHSSQNLRRGHYEIAAGESLHDRFRIAFDELALCI